MALLLSVLMVFPMVPTTVWDASISIDETSFPDEAFRQYMETNFDKNGDKVLSDDEITDVTTIDVTDQGISSLKGIEYFTDLLYLHCNDNQLTELDVSNNTSLISLFCSHNALTELDLSQYTNLYYLWDAATRQGISLFRKQTVLGNMACTPSMGRG